VAHALVRAASRRVGTLSRGDDLHHILTQATAYVKDMEAAASEKGKPWTRRPTALM